MLFQITCSCILTPPQISKYFFIVLTYDLRSTYSNQLQIYHRPITFIKGPRFEFHKIINVEKRIIKAWSMTLFQANLNGKFLTAVFIRHTFLLILTHLIFFLSSFHQSICLVAVIGFSCYLFNSLASLNYSLKLRFGKEMELDPFRLMMSEWWQSFQKKKESEISQHHVA